MPEKSDHIRFDNGLLRCVISTRSAGCSLNHAMMTRFASTIRSLGTDAGAILLIGQGENFCTGGNVKAFASADDPAAVVGGFAAEFHDFLMALVEAPAPVVAGVQGWAAGAGMSLACAADVVVGGPSTRFRAAYSSLGYSPDGGLSWTLQRSVGFNRARDLILTDTVLTGEQAFRIGLLTRVVPDFEVADHALAVATSLAAGPTGSHARIKRLLWEAPERTFAEHLDAEAAAVAECADSPAGREGVAAFAQRRAADFAAASARP
ncbi:enoyl-CoA hydratase/isomerase family protein [Microbispora sp. NEAU-D428]|uniref:enoyl-CoA hydratase/isomerase family protein n=1 Tax=Microbispora sitophila TaxID=2771537 RepID=UPI001868DD04|nr:enoyl-CoA hydratase-related protein [Microbispora sitophila]MBE3008761.1 enoyl-CoA hydratase/isomerase family protein [Microbispora sitophila]